MTISLQAMTQDHALRLPPHNRCSRAVKDASVAVGAGAHDTRASAVRRLDAAAQPLR
jgi:hypothetical protein